jgi:hypothetical protein
MWLDLLPEPPRQATGSTSFAALSDYRKALNISE